MTEIYRPLYLNQAPLLFTARRSAELIKYAANAFLALKISFINEIADLCEVPDVDLQEIARGIGLDNRNGSKFLHAGPGYGGLCFPKDSLALVKTAQDHGSPLRLVETTVAINDQRERGMARKLTAVMKARVFVDLRNVYRPEDVIGQGYAYSGIGRPTPSAEIKKAAQ